MCFIQDVMIYIQRDERGRIQSLDRTLFTTCNKCLEGFTELKGRCTRVRSVEQCSHGEPVPSKKGGWTGFQDFGFDVNVPAGPNSLIGFKSAASTASHSARGDTSLDFWGLTSTLFFFTSA